MERAERIILLCFGLLFDSLLSRCCGHVRPDGVHRGPAVREGLAAGERGASGPGALPLAGPPVARPTAARARGDAPPEQQALTPVGGRQRGSSPLYKAGAQISQALPELVRRAAVAGRGRRLRPGDARPSRRPSPAISAACTALRCRVSLTSSSRPAPSTPTRGTGWNRSASPRCRTSRSPAHFTHEGFGHVADVLADGTGVILALPHLGGWEWAGRWIADCGLADHGDRRAASSPLSFSSGSRTFRRSLGMNVVPLGPGAASAAIKAVKANGVLCLLSDRDIGGEVSRSSSSASARRCPPAPRRWRSARARRCCRPRLLPTAPAGHFGKVGAPLTAARVAPCGRHRTDHARPGVPTRGADPRRARAVAPAAAELAQRPGLRRVIFRAGSRPCERPRRRRGAPFPRSGGPSSRGVRLPPRHQPCRQRPSGHPTRRRSRVAQHRGSELLDPRSCAESRLGRIRQGQGSRDGVPFGERNRLVRPDGNRGSLFEGEGQK